MNISYWHEKSVPAEGTLFRMFIWLLKDRLFVLRMPGNFTVINDRSFAYAQDDGRERRKSNSPFAFLAFSNGNVLPDNGHTVNGSR